MAREEAIEAIWSNGHGESNWIINKIYNDHEAELKTKDEEIRKLNNLYADTIKDLGDMAKSDDAMFRGLVENKQKERWELPITTDGYKIILKEQQ